MNVLGNQFKGKGSEDSQYYDQCMVLFMGIRNIHAVRESFHCVVCHCPVKTKTIFKCRYYQVDMCQDTSDERWFFKLDASRWLHQVHKLISTSVRISDAIEKDVSSMISV